MRATLRLPTNISIDSTALILVMNDHWIAIAYQDRTNDGHSDLVLLRGAASPKSV